jgi:membrane protease YdiL (CAAX protease family)
MRRVLEDNPFLPGILPFLEYFLFMSGMAVFACFIHGDGPGFRIALAGLLFSSLVIVKGTLWSADPLSLMGLARIDRRAIRLSLQFSVVGIGLAALCRYATELSLVPHTLTTVALITPFIGMTEELVFRGFLQGRLRKGGIFISVFLASAGHALYKYLVLRSMAFDVGTDLTWLALSTLAIGLVLGAYREKYGSIVPAMIAHAVFDIYLYGDSLAMPAWVWR